MTMAPLPRGLVVPDVDEETHNRNLLRVAEEEADHLGRLPEIFPKLQISPGLKLRPFQRLQNLMRLIGEAYTFPQPDGSLYFDQQGALYELENLLDPEYLERMKTGMAPAPLARPWAQLLPIRFVWRELQKTFIADYRAWQRRVEQDG